MCQKEMLLHRVENCADGKDFNFKQMDFVTKVMVTVENAKRGSFNIYR